MSKYVKVPNNKNYILEWKSKGISEENIKPPKTINNILNPLLEYDNKLKLKFNGSCLRQDKITFIHGQIVNIYIVYDIIKIYNKMIIQHWIYLEKSVLTKNADIGK